MATLLFTDEIPEVLREVEKFAQGFTAGDEERPSSPGLGSFSAILAWGS